MPIVVSVVRLSPFFGRDVHGLGATVGLLDAVPAILAFVVGIAQARPMSAVITALCASIAMAVGGAVRILGHLLEWAQGGAPARRKPEGPTLSGGS